MYVKSKRCFCVSVDLGLVFYAWRWIKYLNKEVATGNLLKLPVATIEKEKEFITGRLSKCVQSGRTEGKRCLPSLKIIHKFKPGFCYYSELFIGCLLYV